MRLRWAGGQLCPSPTTRMAKGSWLDWGLQMACEEWGRAFGIDHISWHSSQRFVSWWANGTLVNEHGVLRYVPLCDCHIHFHVVLPIRTVLLYRLSTWGMDPQTIAYKGCPQSKWSERLVSGPCELVCFLQVGLLSGDTSRSRTSTQHLFHWYFI